MNTIQNQATISYVSSGITNTVRTPDVNTTIVDPNISLIKSCCVPSAQRGDVIRYTISVINSGEIATDGNVVIKDYLDKAGSHVGTTSEVWRNNIPLTAAPSIDTLNRGTYWFEYTPDNLPSITLTSLIPGDFIVITYSVLIDTGTPLINNELHNTATATFTLNSKEIIQRSAVCTVNIDYSYLLVDKRGRAQGYHLSKLYYALELTNEGTSEASDIEIIEDFPNSFQPDSGFADVQKDIAIVNFIRFPNTIQNIITTAENQEDSTASLYQNLNAKYYRLKALQQDVLAKIAQVSTLTTQQQQELINTTAVTIIPELQNSQELATGAYNSLFVPIQTSDPAVSCIYATIETLSTAVSGAKDEASTTTLPDNKDKRASLVCDSHDGGITLLDLCDLTNDAVTMASVVNRYIATMATYLISQFEILAMEEMLLYKTTYKTLVNTLTNARTGLNLCSPKKDLIVSKTAESEGLMTEIMKLVFSDTNEIKENEANYTIITDETSNKLTLQLNAIHIRPQTIIGNTSQNGHMDIYLSGHIEMDKF